MVIEPQPLYKKDIHDEAFEGTGLREGLSASDERTVVLERHQCHQHCEMQRIESAEAQQHECSDTKAFDQPLPVIRRDHEPAEHKEHIHEQVCIAHQRKIAHVAVGMEMIKCNEA